VIQTELEKSVEASRSKEMPFALCDVKGVGSERQKGRRGTSHTN